MKTEEKVNQKITKIDWSKIFNKTDLNEPELRFMVDYEVFELFRDKVNKQYAIISSY